MNKLAATVLVMAGLMAHPCRDAMAASSQGGQMKVTVLFEGLMAFIEDTDGSVWVLLPDARKPTGNSIPAHLPAVVFTEVDKDRKLKNDIPWLLSEEEIHFDSGLSGPVTVKPEVWEGLASLTTLSGKTIKATLTSPDTAPKPMVARLHLRGGTLSVDSRDGARYKAPAGHPIKFGNCSYTTPSAAFVVRWEAEVDSIKVRTTRFCDEPCSPEQVQELQATSGEVRAFIGNLPVRSDPDRTFDDHFAKLYSLIEGTVPNHCVPEFPDPIVGSHLCMGGKR